MPLGSVLLAPELEREMRNQRARRTRRCMITPNANTKGASGFQTNLDPGLVFALALGSWACVASGQEVKVVASSKAGQRLAALPQIRFEAGAGAQSNVFRIDDKVRFQTIAGFGASLLEAGLVC